MLAFAILCLVSVVCADDLGYNYQPLGLSPSGLYLAPSAGIGSAASNIPISSAPGYGIPSLADGSQSGSALLGAAGQPSNGSPSLAEPHIGELEKEFYTYSANNDDFNDPASSNQYANLVKQGLRVIFIKGPENKGFEDAALSLAKQAAQQQTDIYVLNKQTDLADLANKLNQIGNNVNNRPEVRFVKYRTLEDAANAQKAIKDQYDSLGGPSQSINGGIAPVLNFASQTHIAAPSVSTPGTSYLPSSVLRRLRFRF